MPWLPSIRSFLLPLFLLSAGSLAAETRFQVVTLHPLLSEMVTRLAGDAVEVTCLLPANGDVHRSEPAPGDMARARTAGLVLAMGKGLEPYLDRIRENLAEGTTVFEVGRGVPSVTIDPALEIFACCPGHTHGAIDPHWWHSPPAMRRAVRLLGRELEKHLPAQRDEIRQRTETWMEELEKLHEWATAELKQIPRARRQLVTAHAAFGYFCVEYDFKAIPVKGLTDEHKPSPEHLAETVTSLRKHEVTAVFPEIKANNAILHSLRETTGVRIGEPLTADFVLEPGEDYSTVFRRNVNRIVAALSGKPSP